MKHLLQALSGLILAVFVLAGCSSVPSPSNSLEALEVATEYTQALVLSVNEAQGTLSAEDHDKALDIAQGIHDSIQLALTAYEAGNLSETATHLDRIDVALRAIALILARSEQ